MLIIVHMPGEHDESSGNEPGVARASEPATAPGYVLNGRHRVSCSRNLCMADDEELKRRSSHQKEGCRVFGQPIALRTRSLIERAVENQH